MRVGIPIDVRFCCKANGWQVTDEASPAGAIVTIEDPAKDSARIIADVKAGFIVHTFADADAIEARKKSVLRRDWAIASGAQIVSTDFLLPDKNISSYQVRVSDSRHGQCDVQLLPERCAGLDIELENEVAKTKPINAKHN